jgi:hypothetical protein
LEWVPELGRFGDTVPVTTTELTFPIALLVAAAAAVVIIYLGVRGPAGVVGWQPPEGSSRVPVYSFFIAWFISGLAARADEGLGGGWLWVRLSLLLIVVTAMSASWWRLRRSPNLPPRI